MTNAGNRNRESVLRRLLPSVSTGARDVRTSLSHPLRIDAVSAGSAGGLIGITFCPGKCGDSAGSHRWERDLTADLDAIALWRSDAVVTLTSPASATPLPLLSQTTVAPLR